MFSLYQKEKRPLKAQPLTKTDFVPEIDDRRLPVQSLIRRRSEAPFIRMRILRAASEDNNVRPAAVSAFDPSVSLSVCSAVYIVPHAESQCHYRPPRLQ